MNLLRFIFIAFLLVGYSLSTPLYSQDHNHDHQGHDHSGHQHEGHNHDHHDHSGHDHSSHDHSGHDHGSHDHAAHATHSGAGAHHDADPCGHDPHAHHDYDPTGTAIHHISDGNVFTILDAFHIPLPTILKHESGRWDVFMSSKFGAGHHGDGHYAYQGYVLHHGNVHIVKEADFPVSKDKIEIGSFAHGTETVDGKEKDIVKFCYNNKAYTAIPRSTLDGGLLGGGITPFMDFSITKHVASMIIISLLLFFLFRSVAKAYQRREGEAPRGLQGFMETFVVFIRDEVAKPSIGEHKYEKFLPLLLTIFFFILGLNLWGQVPFFGSVNVTGTISVTMVLAIIVFIVVNINGNGHYWGHIFWMPGVPVFVKPVLAIVEVMGLFIKPLTLMLRLAGNITAGHIAILSFIGLIFIFGDAGRNMMGGSIGAALAVPLTLFMMAIEIVVAFVQAYVFTLLTASYLGAATEEEHH